jgi:hypothetical protein
MDLKLILDQVIPKIPAIILTVLMNGGALIILWKAVVKTKFEKIIEGHKHELDKKFADYNQALSQQSDFLKHDLQKEILSAQIAIQSRHKIYAELYKFLHIAHGTFSSLYGYSASTDYEYYNESDFSSRLQEIGCPSGKKSELLNALKLNSATGIKKFKEYLRHNEEFTSTQKLTEASNFLLINSLYISRVIEEKARGVIIPLKRLSTKTLTDDPAINPTSLNCEAETKLRELRTMMAEELNGENIKEGAIT